MVMEDLAMFFFGHHVSITNGIGSRIQKFYRVAGIIWLSGIEQMDLCPINSIF